MPGPRSPRVIELPADLRATLGQVSRSSTATAGRVRRARIVLLAAEGVPLRQIAARVGVDRKVVRKWLDRFRQRGLAGLDELPRPGRPRSFSPCGGAAGGAVGL
jgi:Winged helix-turn helix